MNKKSENPIWVISGSVVSSSYASPIVFPKDVGDCRFTNTASSRFTWGTCQSGWCPATLVNKYTATDSSQCAMDTSVGWMSFLYPTSTPVNISMYTYAAMKMDSLGYLTVWTILSF